jgi:1,4-alpha-glucan branching enzyme
MVFSSHVRRLGDESCERETRDGDVRDYGGSGQGNFGGMDASLVPSHGRPYSLNVTLPPLSVVFFKSGGA